MGYRTTMRYQDHSPGNRQKPPEREIAEEIAVRALVFIAANQKYLDRFLALSGIEAGAIREAAKSPDFLSGVLGFILAHEPTLMEFCAETGIEPASAASAQRSLSGNDGNEWDSI